MIPDNAQLAVDHYQVKLYDGPKDFNVMLPYKDIQNHYMDPFRYKYNALCFLVWQGFNNYQ